MYRTKEFAILSVATLVLILECYFVIFPQPNLFFISAGLYLFFIPVVTLLLLGERLKDYGFLWRKWPFRMSHTLATVIGLLLLIYVASNFPQVQEHYATTVLMETHPLIIIAMFGCLYFIEEFFFRGFLLFGLRDRFGEFAIVLQAVPFTLFHLGKAPTEVLFSFFVGLLFGHIAFKSESFLPCLLMHWAMGTFMFILMSL